MMQITKVLKKCALLVALLAVSFPSFGEGKNLWNVKVKMLSAFDHTDYLLVQTEPKPDLSGLSCTKDYWLTLAKGTENYEEIFSMLLAASVSQQDLLIGIEDVPGVPECRIRRVAIIAG